MTKHVEKLLVCTNRYQNKYERYYGRGRHPLAYVLYCMLTISPTSA